MRSSAFLIWLGGNDALPFFFCDRLARGDILQMILVAAWPANLDFRRLLYFERAQTLTRVRLKRDNSNHS